ncbi:MAG: 30S ribosomal protein S5 [Planctomycetota bacterium]
MGDQEENKDQAAASTPPAAAAASPAGSGAKEGAKTEGAAPAEGGRGGQRGGQGGNRGGQGGNRGGGQGGNRGGGQGGRGGQGGGRGRGGRNDRNQESSEYSETVVKINRCAAVVKGGRRFSFSALVVCGDGKGRVGVGFGKAKDVAGAVEKGTKDSRRKLVRVPMVGTTIPHEITGRFSASVVKLRPAPKGRGIIGCAAVRAIMEGAGISDIVTKSLGNNNPMNLLKATMDAIGQLRSKEQVEALRGVKL